MIQIIKINFYKKIKSKFSPQAKQETFMHRNCSLRIYLNEKWKTEVSVVLYHYPMRQNLKKLLSTIPLFNAIAFIFVAHASYSI